MESESSSTYT